MQFPHFNGDGTRGLGAETGVAIGSEPETAPALGVPPDLAEVSVLPCCGGPVCVVRVRTEFPRFSRRALMYTWLHNLSRSGQARKQKRKNRQSPPDRRSKF